MSNAISPAFPLPKGEESVHPDWCGLTKREYFAAMAMQGLLANGFVREVITWKHEQPERQIFASEKAVLIADAILSELAKERT